jgi:hypothetical protein
MRVAVYAIAKNEESFVKRWADSAKDADGLYLADTGSGDNTVQIARDCGVKVSSISIEPWRFDDARNASMALIPSDYDYLICLDLDEVLSPGWRDALEIAFKRGVTRPRYTYIWKSDPEGRPILMFAGDKIHSRNGYRWKYPCHETLVSDRIEETQYPIPLEIRHYPDESKPRTSYLELLHIAAFENPFDSRCSFYLGRELFLNKRYVEATAELQRYLDLPTATWDPERAGAMRLIAQMNPLARIEWLEKAASEYPTQREPLVDLAHAHYEEENWPACLEAASRALDIKERPVDFPSEDYAWGHEPWDLAAIASHRLGLREQAIVYGRKAIELSDTAARERLQKNLDLYLESSK